MSGTLNEVWRPIEILCLAILESECLTFGRAAICINTDSSLLTDVICWMCILLTDFSGPSQTAAN
jgi:hypothetical protein